MYNSVDIIELTYTNELSWPISHGSYSQQGEIEFHLATASSTMFSKDGATGNVKAFWVKKNMRRRQHFTPADSLLVDLAGFWGFMMIAYNTKNV
jgi:hypothetical protein